MVIVTLATDEWDVRFSSVKMGLGRWAPLSLLYHM